MAGKILRAGSNQTLSSTNPDLELLESGHMIDHKNLDSYSTSTGGNSNSSNKSGDYDRRSSSVVLGRALFVTFLVLVAAALGFLAYFLLRESEIHLVKEQYFSMTARALEATRSIATNKLQHGTMVMSKVASYSFPDASSWPFVWIDGYWDIVASVIPTSCYTGIHLAPIVQPDQAAAFEEHAYGKFAETFGENTTMGAYSHFGKGIWVQDPSIDSVDNRFHDTTGVSIHGSPYQMLVPKLQHALKDSPYVMMNVHGFRRQGEAVDAAINCTKFERPNDPSNSCQSLSAMNKPKVMANGHWDDRGPFGFISTPIFPQNDPDTLVGFIFGAVFWSEVMEDIFPHGAEGIDCVFSAQFGDEVEHYTYTIEDGSGVFVGPGDLHDTKWDEYRMEQVLLEPGSMSKGSAIYTTQCYPNDNFPSTYTTTNPITAAVGACLIILITSALFFLYDKCVRREFDARKDLLEAKRQFVRFVSHEVRTPLNSVCMGLTLMKEEMAQSLGFKNADEMISRTADKELDDDNPTLACFELANEVHTNAQCSVDVLNDLLNYDKIESGTLSLELRVVPIWNLIERTVVEFKLPMASKNITLHFKLPSDSDEKNQITKLLNLQDQKVVGDSVRITQVLRNLVSNAIKFTPEGGNIYVEAKWKQAEYESKDRRFDVGKEKVSCRTSGQIIVTVKDTGAGMTKAQLKKLFGKGVQFNVNELQHGNGSGLGLYIAMGIVQQHEGSLVCDSEGLGFGTTFTMNMPVYNIPKAEGPGGNDHEHGHGDFDDTFEDPKLKILIVDDAVSNRKLLGRLLKTKGHETEQAEDGDVGVEMVKEAEAAGKPFDLVLLDYEMPNLNGPGAALEIRKNGSDAFLVGVTGNLMPEDVAYFRNCGANAVLPKPFRLPDLENLIFEHHITPSNSSHRGTGIVVRSEVESISSGSTTQMPAILAPTPVVMKPLAPTPATMQPLSTDEPPQCADNIEC